MTYSLSANIYYDDVDKQFHDKAKGNAPIGTTWWDVFSYGPYRDEYKNSTGQDVSVAKFQADQLALPGNPARSIVLDETEYNRQIAAGATPQTTVAYNQVTTNTSANSNVTTTATGNSESHDVGFDLGRFMNTQILGLPLWLVVVAGGLLAYGVYHGD